MGHVLEKILNDRFDELEPYQQYILSALVFIPIAPFMIVPLMFIAFMFTLNGLNEMMDTEYVPGGHVEPTEPRPTL